MSTPKLPRSASISTMDSLLAMETAYLGPHQCNKFYPLFYTFGVEIELVVRVRLADYDVESVDDDLRLIMQNRIRLALKDQGYRVRWQDIDEMQPGRGMNPDDLLKWGVNLADPAKQGLRSKIYGFIPIELSSPVMKFIDSAEENPFRKIAVMLIDLKERFDISVNDKCSFTVHVGAVTDPVHQDYRLSRGFPLAIVRNLMQLGILFEQELSALHPRVPYNNPCTANPNTLIQSNRTPIALMGDELNFDELHSLWMDLPNNDNHWAQERFGGLRMQECNTAICFCNLVNEHGRSMALDNDGQHPNPSTVSRSLRTIKFRQHAGTLDFVEMYNWIKTCIRLIQFSHECGPNGLPLWLVHFADVREASKPDPDSVDPTEFLRMIGAHEQAAYYSERGTYDHDFHIIYTVPIDFPLLDWARQTQPGLLVPPILTDTSRVIMSLWKRYSGIESSVGPDSEERDQNGNFPDLLYREEEY